MDDEKGLFINCQYSWNGSKLRPREGSGSKGDWHNDRFRWACFPLGSFRPLYEYEWDDARRVFSPVGAADLPVWEVSGSHFKNAVMIC